MTLDLVAVRRDAVLLDDLAQRAAHLLDIDTGHRGDPVVGLLAALVASVDDGVADVADRPAALIPAQNRRGARAATVSALPVALAPVGRRHVVRAVAAMVVTVAVLSVSGAAAAVSGDPLTPYKIVFDAVRGHGDAVPKSLPGAGAMRATGQSRDAAVALGYQLAVERGAVAPPASRSTDRRHIWDDRVADRAGWDLTGGVRGGSVRDGGASDTWGGQSRDSRGWDARQRPGDNAAGRHRIGDDNASPAPSGDDNRSRDGDSNGSATGADSGGDQAGSVRSRR